MFPTHMWSSRFLINSRRWRSITRRLSTICCFAPARDASGDRRRSQASRRRNWLSQRAPHLGPEYPVEPSLMMPGIIIPFICNVRRFCAQGILRADGRITAAWFGGGYKRFQLVPFVIGEASNTWLLTKRVSVRVLFAEPHISDFELSGLLVNSRVAARHWKLANIGETGLSRLPRSFPPSARVAPPRGPSAFTSHALCPKRRLWLTLRLRTIADQARSSATAISATAIRSF